MELSFNFGLLPEEEYEKVKVLVTNRDLDGLLEIHEKYELSEYDYCCNGSHGLYGLLAWFEYGIKEGYIK